MLRLSANSGYAKSPLHAATRGELTCHAELALRAAVRKGPGSIVAFELSIDTVSTDQRFIRRELPRALSANELELHYQSIVAAQGNGIVVVEALLRWNHPIRGLIMPSNRHRPRPSTGCWHRPKTVAGAQPGRGRAADRLAGKI